MVNAVEAQGRLDHPNIKVLRDGGKIKPRHASGMVIGSVTNNLFFYNNTMSVMKRALTERLYYVKDGLGGFKPCPKPTPGAFNALHPFRQSLLRNLPQQPPVWSYDEFVASYTGPKRTRYATAVSNLKCRGLRRSDGYWKTFIKAEWYDGTNKADPCPRLIQPRSYEYNVVIGRYLRPAEKLIYKAIDRVFGHHVVLKCDSPWKRAETIVSHWNAIPNPCFVGMDASRFDQHISADALRFEHGVYNAIFDSPELMKALSWQIDNVGYANVSDGSYRYTVEGCRGSGDMNTALGNVLLMCAVSYVYLESLGVPYRFINDGDDCGFIISKEYLPLVEGLPQYYLNFGFEMEVEAPCYDVESIEFCQAHPVQLREDQWTMVRNVEKCLKQDLLVISSRDWATTAEVLHATGLCGLALYEGVPILDTWYRRMLSDSVRADRVDRLLDASAPRTWRSFASSSRPYEVDLCVARPSFYRAFGIAPDHQAAMEDDLRALKFGSHKRPLYNSSTSRIQYFLDQ